MVIHLFPGWVNAGENGGSKLVKKTLFSGSMLVVIYTTNDSTNRQLQIHLLFQGGTIRLIAKYRCFNPEDMAHIGIVVKDIEASRDHLSSILGLDSWTSFDYVSSKETLIQGEPFNIKIAGATMGSVGIELIQPFDCPESLWSQFITTKGEGVHHIAFKVTDFNQTVGKLKDNGAKVLVSVSLDPAMCWCYIETRPGGLIMELMNFDLKF